MEYFVIYFPMQTLCLNSQYPTIKNIWLLLWVCFVNGLQSSKQTFQGKRNQSGHCIVFLLVEHLVKGANNSGFCFEWNYESDVEELFIKSCTIGIWLRRCKKKKKNLLFFFKRKCSFIMIDKCPLIIYFHGGNHKNYKESNLHMNSLSHHHHQFIITLLTGQNLSTVL